MDAFIALAALLSFIAPFPSGAANAERGRGELREMWEALAPRAPEAVYAREPRAEGPFDVGELNADYIGDALEYASFIRWVAGLDGVEIEGVLALSAQSGALLTAANGFPSHSPPMPDGYPEGLYAEGAEACANCNLAAFNWMEAGILRLALDSFARDDGGGNEKAVGHRRWLLSPSLRRVGFGLANDAAGNSFAAMCVTDRGEPADYDIICWPPPGAFPAEFMSAATPWSASPNPEKYDLSNSDISVAIEDLRSGEAFELDSLGDGYPDGAFLAVDFGRYGEGPAIVFRPSLGGGYSQNRRYRVEIKGLLEVGGALAEPYAYEVSFVSLVPIDPVDVEIDEIGEMAIGQCAALKARVIPDWADDLSLAYASDDPSVAFIGDDGEIAALGAGTVTLTATAANGVGSSIIITVTD